MYHMYNRGMKKGLKTGQDTFSKEITRGSQLVIITENVEHNILNILLVDWIVEYQSFLLFCNMKDGYWFSAQEYL